jgi:hypothetical protein
VVAVILACAFLPFLPGACDPVAWAPALAAYPFGIVGLLVPIGARRHPAGRADHGQPRLLADDRPELEGFYAEHAAGRPHWTYFWFD